MVRASDFERFWKLQYGLFCNKSRGRTGTVVRASDFGPRGPWFEPRPGAVRCGLEQVTFTPCLVLVKPKKRWTDHGQTVTRLETTLCLMC